MFSSLGKPKKIIVPKNHFIAIKTTPGTYNHPWTLTNYTINFAIQNFEFNNTYKSL